MCWLENQYLSHPIEPHFIKPNLRGLQQKLAELRQERGEHELVAETLKKAEPERKAWRLVGKRRFYRTYISNRISFQILKYLFCYKLVSGGVLTERTVGEVLPALQSQIENITKVNSIYLCLEPCA